MLVYFLVEVMCMFDYAYIKEKGKNKNDDLVLNELFIGDKKARSLTNVIETDNLMYYLSDDVPSLLFIVPKDPEDHTYTIVGFNLAGPGKVMSKQLPKIVVDKQSTLVSMYPGFGDTKPVIRSFFDHLTGKWDVRYDVYRFNEPSNLKDSLGRLKQTELDPEGLLSTTLDKANETLSKLSIKRSTEPTGPMRRLTIDQK